MFVMSAAQQFVMIFASLVILIVVFGMVANKKLLLRYALLWIALSVLLVLCAVIPGPLFSLAHWLGFESSSNFIFVMAVLFLLVSVLSLTAVVSKQSEAIKNAVQRIAILEHELNQKTR